MQDTDIIATVAGLQADSWRGAYRGIYSDYFLDHEVDAQRVKFWHRRLPALRAMTAELYLATVSDVPAGFLCIEVDSQDPSMAFIDNLHVLPRFQRGGIASALITRATAWALGHDVRSLRLFVLAANTEAQRFYARNGWQVVGRAMYGLANGGEAPVLRLVKSLSKPTRNNRTRA